MYNLFVWRDCLESVQRKWRLKNTCVWLIMENLVVMAISVARMVSVLSLIPKGGGGGGGDLDFNEWGVLPTSANIGG